MKRFASIVVLFALLLASARAEARGCSEQSASRAVGLASCHRFGDWDAGGWSPSFASGFVFRTIPLPNDLDVCARTGKSCSTVGSLGTMRPSPQHAYTGVIDITALGWGPFRFGAELGLGGTDGGVLGSYDGITFRTNGFMFASAAASGGLAFGVGRVGFRFDGLAGVSGLTSDLGVKDANGKSLEVSYTYPQLEGRATVLYQLSPWVSLGAVGGYGYGDVWHVGAVVRLSLTPWDNTH